MAAKGRTTNKNLPTKSFGGKPEITPKDASKGSPIAPKAKQVQKNPGLGKKK